ncbi:aurora protein [Raphidocelis subcapitata]|uniref:Aurora kinase n=1 Tax=Raphidocelis subcapitata TaxID=307507 RepID=A0A2V0PAI1_9CHLO|nr:aurora protein [Raphidocelis subcapitata]|eukprot:GBF96529.1 aurora protein [Raphidocelis subcapitata]
MQLFGSSERQQCSQTLLVTRHCPQEMRSRSSWSVDQFVVAKKLGGGYASTVHLALDKASGIQVALKVYHRVKLSQLNQYQVKREVRIHACLDHPNVLKLFAAFEDESGVYLVTEFASRGDVFGELDRRGGTMSESEAVRAVLAPFMSALRYLHALNIIHRDIKPENLLMTAAGELKVADFGLSIDITQERPVTRVGTLDYMAPEVVVCPDKCLPSDNKEKTHLHYDRLVDAWAVGVLAYELTVGRAPFDAGNKRATIEQILRGTPTYPAWLSEQARHFISWSLTKDAKARPDVQELAYHPWITGHAAAARPRAARLVPGRAASAADLHTLRPVPAVDTTAHMEARHRALGVGQIGNAAPLGSVSSDGSAGDAASDATGAPAAASPSATPSPPPSTASAGSAGSPFAAPKQQAAPPAGAGGAAAARGVLESAADGLRAYVTRCQSANNLESLRAAVASQRPPEPSNACFEPGGRYYSPGASLLPRATPGGAVPVAAQQHQQQQHQQQHQQQQQQRVAPHDSVTSVPSVPCPKPPASPARPPALQLVRLPSPALAAHGPGVAAPKAPLSPARSPSPMPITPEGVPAPRLALFSKSPAGRPSSLRPRGGGGGGGSRSSGASAGDPMQVDSSSAGHGSGSGSDGSSCGSAAEFVSVCSGGQRSHPGAAAAAVLTPPEPVSPPQHTAAAAAKAAAAAAAAGGGALLRSVLGGVGGGDAPSSGGSWFGLHCVNFLRPGGAK